MKLGKQPATHSSRDLLAVDLRDPAARSVAVPARFGHGLLVPVWGMLGNDAYGDCVWAGAAHETMLWNAAAGHPVKFDDKHVLAAYTAVTGFNPNDPKTDEGTEVRAALSYRRHTGIADANGKRHKIGAYVALEPGNWDQIIEAAYVFEAVGIGFRFPNYAMDQFDAGRPWTVRPGGYVDGGHYVPVAGRSATGYVDVVTWGRVQRMSHGFLTKYCDEAWAIVSAEILGAAGVSLEGYSLAALRSLLADVSTP